MSRLRVAVIGCGRMGRERLRTARAWGAEIAGVYDADAARAEGARVVVTPDWPGYGPQNNRGVDVATGDWFFSLDASNAVAHPTKNEATRCGSEEKGSGNVAHPLADESVRRKAGRGVGSGKTF